MPTPKKKASSKRERIKLGHRPQGPICLALDPMAVGFGEGSEMNAPMARVVIGGMLVSALFTLFFVPTLYGSIRGVGRD